MKKVFLSLLVACIFAVTTTGCFGSFALTKQVKSAADGINNKVVKEIVYFFGTVPVLAVCTILGDFIILNTFEYWIGSNPVALDDIYRETDANGNSVTAVKMEEGSLYMRLDAAGGETLELVLQKDEEQVRILDVKGKLLHEVAYAE